MPATAGTRTATAPAAAAISPIPITQKMARRMVFSFMPHFGFEGGAMVVASYVP
jgi:hypothetical protein